jgi:hypothetical protein
LPGGATLDSSSGADAIAAIGDVVEELLERSEIDNDVFDQSGGEGGS